MGILLKNPKGDLSDVIFPTRPNQWPFAALFRGCKEPRPTSSRLSNDEVSVRQRVDGVVSLESASDETGDCETDDDDWISAC
jgi:hypothetical protein